MKPLSQGRWERRTGNEIAQVRPPGAKATLRMRTLEVKASRPSKFRPPFWINKEYTREESVEQDSLHLARPFWAKRDTVEIKFATAIASLSDWLKSQFFNQWEAKPKPTTPLIEQFSNDCRKTKTKGITPTNHNRIRQRDEPITIPSNYL